MNEGFTLTHFREIEIRISWSVLVIVALVTWSLGNNVLPELADGYRDTEYFLVAAGLAVAMLVGLVAHELGHSLVAAREGVRVSSVTLWLFGGLAQLEERPANPRSAGRIAIAGPMVSALIGVIALSAAAGFDGLAAAAIGWFGVINLALAVFNLLPAFPMDGGRIYQSWWWQRTGDELAATQRAAALGQRIGAVLIGLGVLQALFGGTVGGIWLAMIGWFVREAARAELEQVTVVGPLGDVPITEVMTSHPERVLENASLESFVSEMVLGGRHTTYPVMTPDGDLTGLVSLEAVRSVDRTLWESTTVGAVATSLGDVATIDLDSSVADALLVADRTGRSRTLVLDGDRLVGIVAPADLARLIGALHLAGRGAFESVR
jgi:Zn-dependent protease